jgi:hypothetical protein
VERHRLVSMLTAADPAVDPLYPARWLGAAVSAVVLASL